MNAPGGYPFVVGVAGASGSGKSTVAAHVAERFGGVHIDADRVAHQVLAGDAHVIADLRAAFGGAIFTTEGAVDRRRLGALVFADAGALARLNAIVHPPVMRMCDEMVRAAAHSGARIAVVDAVLLLEVEMPFTVDLMLALQCARAIRLRRILDRGGWTEAEVNARLDRQAGVEKHFYKADAVVDTGRTLDAVLADVDRLVQTALNLESD